MLVIVALAAAVALLVGVVVVDSRVASADAADLDAGQQAFLVADCQMVRGHAGQLDHRWRPPWVDGPRLTDAVQGCTDLDDSLVGAPSARVVALANLRATTAHPSIGTAAGERLRQLLASADLANGADDPLCTEIGGLLDQGRITADDHPFTALRRCGLRRADQGRPAQAVELFKRAAAIGSSGETASLSTPPVVDTLLKAPDTCGSLAALAGVLGAQAPGKYASCGDAALAANNQQTAVGFYADLLQRYPQSPEATQLAGRLAGQPGLCPASAPTGRLSFATDPTWLASHKLACARQALAVKKWPAAKGYLDEAVAKGADTQPARDAAALLDAMHPASGTRLGETTIRLSGRIALTVVNHTEDDLVAAALAGDGRAVRFYVRTGETATVKAFPTGSYRLLIVTGTQYLPDQATFADLGSVSQISKPFAVPAGFVGTTTLTLGGDGAGDPVTRTPPACADLVAAGLPPEKGCTGPA